MTLDLLFHHRTCAVGDEHLNTDYRASTMPRSLPNFAPASLMKITVNLVQLNFSDAYLEVVQPDQGLSSSVFL